MLDDLTEACREPIAEMERNGLTAAAGWSIIKARGGGYPEIQFSRKSDGAAVFYCGSAGFPWCVADKRDKGGGGPTLAAAIANAAADGYPL